MAWRWLYSHLHLLTLALVRAAPTQHAHRLFASPAHLACSPRLLISPACLRATFLAANKRRIAPRLSPPQAASLILSSWTAKAGARAFCLPRHVFLFAFAGCATVSYRINNCPKAMSAHRDTGTHQPPRPFIHPHDISVGTSHPCGHARTATARNPHTSEPTRSATGDARANPWRPPPSASAETGR